MRSLSSYRFDGLPRVAFREVRCTALVVAIASGAAVGCSSGDPLGGPYGGTTFFTGPTPGNANSGDSGPLTTDGGQDSAGGGGDATSGMVDGASSVTEGGDALPAIDGAHAPTWTAIYNDYLMPCQACHYQMMSAPSAYSWLQSQDYIAGVNSPLVNPSESCLWWYGGNMPPDGMSNPAAVADMNAWAQAGAPYD
jgi:hypothetical protein